MKTVLFLILIFLMPLLAIAHPGKTDYKGGHKCWKNCGQWELKRGEYHLHDKAWNPIRFTQKGDIVEEEKSKKVPTPDKQFLLEEPAEKTSTPDEGPDTGSASGLQKNSGTIRPAQHVVVEKNQTLTVYNESVLPLNTIILLLLAFLMLIVLIFGRKRR